MKFIKFSSVVSFLVIFLWNASFVYSQNSKKKQFVNGISKVVKIPFEYDYPTLPALRSTGKVVEKPWIVYSDRSNNNTYTDSKLSTTFQKVAYLDSFYVSKETKDALEIIRCTPSLLQNNGIDIIEPAKTEYLGWIEKSKLLLSEKSYLDPFNRRPLKYVTVLSGTKIFDRVKAFAEGTKLKVSDGPDSQVLLTKDLSFDEIVYVYKKSKDKVLVGRKPQFNIKNANNIILGWAQTEFVQSWGQRLCIEPFESTTSPKKPPLVFATKDLAITSNSNIAMGYALNEEGCSKPKHSKKRLPIIKTEVVTKGTDKFRVLQTGALISTTDKSKSFIYNINGAKISYTRLCELVSESNKVNIVFAVNAGSDTKEYLNVLVNSLQELAGFFLTKKGDYEFHFGATDCSSQYASNAGKLQLVEQYSDIVPSLINIARSGLENRSTSATASSIVNGLNNALKILKGHEDESNIIVVISSQADNSIVETTNKLLKENVANDIAKSNTRLLFMQPYCGNAPAYSNFIQQAKSHIKSSAEKAAGYKRERAVENNMDNSSQNSFKTVRSGTNNVYCLDYPQNANYQGFLLFPTIGNNIDDAHFNEALDSLLQQIDLDNDLMTNAIREVFNSPSSFNNSTGASFKRFYATTQDGMPADVSYYMKNIDYNYFINGYVAYQTAPIATPRPFKYSLLLSADEYEELYTVFKNLQMELMSPNYDIRSRMGSYNASLKTIKRYATERQIEVADYITIGKLMHLVGGYYTENKLLNKYKVTDLKSESSIPKDEFKVMADYLNTRINNFYSIKNNGQHTYMSKGMKYYWVNEDYLP